jgi:PAS domain S-box-containing protein
MTEITRVHLEHEMDLILAHKQAMKLGELCGLSLPAQTTLATAISELGRAGLEHAGLAVLVLHTSDRGELPKAITARLRVDSKSGFSESSEGYSYAKKLVQNISLKVAGGELLTDIQYGIPATTHIDPEIQDRWRRYMNTDPDVSPYEEIKRKNRQLQELANKLGESEQQYRDLTDSLPLIIYTMDASGNLLFGNKWLGDYSGQSIAQLNTSQWRETLSPADRKAVMENIGKLSKGDYVKDIEYRLKHAGSGLYRWHLGTITPVTDETGATRYWSVFLADIHAQKEVEAMLKDNSELRETQAQLEEKVYALDRSNKQLEQFAYVASHDLQEPLRKIIHFAGFLGRQYGETLPAEAHDVLSRMTGATERMKSLINDVLAYSTIPNETNSWECVSLNIIVREVMQEFEMAIAESRAIIEVSKLPDVEGIAAQLKQLISNIISNALKYAAPDRPPHVRIDGMVNGNILSLQLEDNGIGFENQYVPKIFDLFQRLHGRDKYSGTGIGLAICRKIVELHNGSIEARGIFGEGAVFTRNIPLQQNASLGIPEKVQPSL